VDGEPIGILPATFQVLPRTLRLKAWFWLGEQIKG
jgi:diacylglycerol kinase family enzyme